MVTKSLPPYEPPRGDAPNKTKAFAYILKRTAKGKYHLLVLAHEKFDGLRFPGGNLHEDEDPLEGMFREVQEESGLKRDDLEVLRLLGMVEYYKPVSDDNIRRHDYLLLVSPNTPEQWEHTVKGDDNDAGRNYHYRFITPDRIEEIDREFLTFVRPEYMPEFFNAENTRVVIVDYDPAWQEQFNETKERLMEKLGDGHVAFIEHIGSTAVHELAAKPIIDILVAVESLSDADQDVVPAICDLGYQYVPEHESTMPNRRYFRLFNQAGQVIEHVHLFQRDDEDVERHLLFRDYLRAHPQTRDDYEKLKRQLANTVTREEYTDGKTEFIREIVQRGRG